MTINLFLEKLDSFLWNGVLIYLLLAVGIFLTIRLKGMQFKYLPLSLKYIFKKHDENAKGDISQFQSLMTALAATIGIASIAGMATAVTAGGYGAIFWMWVMALIGMVTKYSEGILAIKYRARNKKGLMSGGPMYYIEKGLGIKWLSSFFAIFGALAAFCGGNLIQSQSITDAVTDLMHIPPVVTGVILMLIVAVVIIGGIKSLGKVNAYLVPIMAVIYIAAGLIIIAMRIENVLPGILMIFKSAFNFKAVGGGFLGIGIMNAMQMGIARGISSNEAGLGSAPIASAAAKTDVPGRQALMSMSGVFLSSFIVCTITVLVLAVTNSVGQLSSTGEVLNGAPLVMHAFSSIIPGGGAIVAIGLILFGLSTILGWSYYGEKCMEYILGDKSIKYYRLLFILFVFLGSQLSIQTVWPLADIMNGLMAFPNLIGLVLLSKVVVDESNIFFKLVKKEKELQYD